MKSLVIVMMLLFTAGSYAGELTQTEEEQAIRNVLARFYGGLERA